MSEYDSPWKSVLDHQLVAALAFTLPAFHDDMDWTRDYESLDQELHKLAPAGETGKRLADKLIKAYQRGTGDPRYLHVEVQGQPIHNLPERVDVYNYRARDRFGQPVCSLVVLADDDPDWRPNRYEHEQYGTRHTLEFDIFKVLDWQGRETELEAHPNVFALFVLAHLSSRQTRHDPEERARAKLRLLLLLVERQLDAGEMHQWYRYLDWLLDLPPEHDKKVTDEVRKVTEGKPMPFIPYFERVAREEGLREGRYLAIERRMSKKFGAEGLALMQGIRQVSDSERLEEILDAVVMATTLDEVRKLLPAQT
jgi:hypothetical protein